MAKQAKKAAPKKRVLNRPAMTRQESRLLEGAMAGGFAFVIGSIFLISSLQSFFMQTNQFASVISAVLVDLANTDRVAYNVGQLKVNDKLVAAAQAKANDMAAKSYFAHTSPEGIDSWYWFKQAGYDFQHAGENLAVDFSDSADVERAWMNSPSHRDNILNGRYTEIGIATASGVYQGHPTTFVVQEFGTPRVGTEPAPAKPSFESVPSNPTQIAVADNPSSVLGEKTDVPVETPVAVPEVHPKPVAHPTPGTQPVVVAEQNAPQAAALIPAPKERAPVGAIVPTRQSNDWEMLVTSPRTSMQYAYYLLALLVLLALAVDTGLELKWHHRRRATTAGFMLAAMVVLFWYANYSMFTHAVVATTAEVVQTSSL